MYILYVCADTVYTDNHSYYFLCMCIECEVVDIQGISLIMILANVYAGLEEEKATAIISVSMKCIYP